MLTRKSVATVLSSALTASLLLAAPVLATDPVDDGVAPSHQHGGDEGHLSGTRAWGKIELIDVVELYDAADLGPGLIADVGVDSTGNYAYLANWGFPDCAGPESGGINSPDAGIYVVDISGIGDPTQPNFEPTEVNFIPTPQDTRPGEGVQSEAITTKFFSGEILAFNHEACGKNYKGGFSLWDVSNPLKPKRLATGVGDRTVNGSPRQISDANETHSVFIWDAGDRAYLVAQDEWESADVDIFDITNPRHPVLVSEVDLDAYGVAQPELDLTSSFLHDMVVKEINGEFIMLLSYWDGGYALLNVTDPANPVFLGDTEYAAIDPLLLEMTGTALTPEGNAHQAEFTIDNRFIIGTDEDFAPFRVVVGGTEGTFNATPGTDVPAIDEETSVTGDAAYVGLACNGSPLPTAETTGATIAIVQRGTCTFTEKVTNVQAAGYEAGVVFNSVAGCDARVTMLVEGDIPFVFVGRTSGLTLLGVENPTCASAAPALGTVVQDVTLSAVFDGWGYVHLFDAATLADLDQYAIPEAMDPAYATGYGDLSVHEVAVDPQDASLAYLSYYSGGLRAVQIQCSDPADTSTCELVEVGGYLDPEGNNFWGVETFVGDDGFTYILASDRDSGLWIFRDP